ncbi:MAG: hypothetical protein KAR80_04695, partial [Rhodospirillaceae bacterium]|nr:hypothetical protein [Rhodospirillaceae bacterium]
ALLSAGITPSISAIPVIFYLCNIGDFALNSGVVGCVVHSPMSRVNRHFQILWVGGKKNAAKPGPISI